ncbi:hypothetical protein P8C59_009237 [Phyllachora maydis]|uniref:PQ-loop repeat-containing protein n=1 Tax=Phyllachora maydis TaxID=1825666 RepID=A0AAD9IDQ2_9PEZI|nr:hypothetical protein P8C59_009237 [Phyllachora maydis]
MAPQKEIPVAANVLGTIGTTLWCVQLVPQIWTNWRTKKTDGLPSSMMFLWALCGVPFGAYDIAQHFNMPLQVQPQIFMALCLVSWAQTLVYGRHWVAWKAAAVAVGVACAFAAVEAGLILTLRPLIDSGDEMGVRVVGIVAAVILAAGILPPYGELWKRQGRVIGINWVFLAMDSNGAFFSLMALVAQNTFDVLGGIMYMTCIVLELGIFTSHIIWLIRTRKIRTAAAAAGKTYDEYVDEYAAGLEAKCVPLERGRPKSRGKSQQAADRQPGAKGRIPGPSDPTYPPCGHVQDKPGTARSRDLDPTCLPITPEKMV